MTAVRTATNRTWGRWKIIALILAAALLAAFVYLLPSIRGYARVGSAYGAHVTCSCRYIGGRSLADCEKDFENGMQIVSVSDDPSRRRIYATVPLLANETAEFREGYGCVLLTKQERDQD